MSAPSNQNLPKFEKLGCTTTNDNYSLLYNFKCSIIFLCVKPHHITPEAHIFKLVTVKHPFIIMSAVAGMTLDALYDNCFTNGVKCDNCCIYREYRLIKAKLIESKLIESKATEDCHRPTNIPGKDIETAIAADFSNDH